MARACGRDPPAADALGVATGISPAPSFPGLAVRAALRRRDSRPLVATRREPLPPDGRRVPRARRRATRAERLGHELPHAARRARRGGRRRLRARRRRAVRARPRRARPSRASRVPERARGDPRVVHAYEPHEYAAQVAVVGAGMAAATEWLNALAAGAEVVSIRRREPLRRPLNVAARRSSRSAGLASFHALAPTRSAPASCATCSAPSYPAGARVGRAARAAAASEGRFRVAAERERRGAGDLRDGLPARLRGTTRCSRPRRRARPRVHERWIVLAPDSTVPALTDDTRTLVARRRRRRSGPSPPPTRSRARSTRPARFLAPGDVVHAERPPRVAPRGGRCRAARARARAAPLVGDRARRADARGRRRARRRGLRPRARRTSPAGLALPLGALELALVYPAARGARCRRSARRRRSCFYAGGVARRRRSARTPSSRGSSSPTPRTAASSAGSGRRRGCRRRDPRRGARRRLRRPAADRPPARRRPGPARHPARPDAGRRRACAAASSSAPTTSRCATSPSWAARTASTSRTPTHVMLDGVRVVGSQLDGIHVRHSDVMVKDCTVSSPAGPSSGRRHLVLGRPRDEHGRGVHDLRRARGHRHPLLAGRRARQPHLGHRRCAASRSARCRWARSSDNVVAGALGVGIFCVDHSECEIEGNTVAGTRRRPGRATRRGRESRSRRTTTRTPTLGENTVVASPGGIARLRPLDGRARRR